MRSSFVLPYFVVVVVSLLAIHTATGQTIPPAMHLSIIRNGAAGTATPTTTRPLVATDTPTATQPATGVCPCDADVRNCNDFNIACESLPPGWRVLD